jgi:hypothetical protein
MVAEQFVCAIDEVYVHDRIIADAATAPNGAPRRALPWWAGASAEDG